MCSRAIKITVSLLLSVTVFCCSFSVFAVDPSPSPTPVPSEDYGPIIATKEYLVSYYIYKVMQSWGLEVTYNNVHGFVEETRDAILSYVLEYIEQTPSIYSINTWIAPWQADMDYWGELQYNQYMVEDIQDFVAWLLDTLGINNNEVTQISGGLSIKGYTVYQTNKWYRVSKYEGYELDDAFIKFTNLQFENSTSQDPIYFVVMDKNQSWMVESLAFFSTYNHSVTMGIESYNLDGTLDFQNPSWTIFNFDQLHGGYYFRSQYYAGQYRFEDAVKLPCRTMDEVYAFFDGSQIETEEGVYVESGTIELPDDNPDYETGDSLVITDSGPIYIYIEWPDTISIDNLPAVISPIVVADPDLEGVYGEVTPFIRTFSGGMDMMRSIIMQLPEEALACLFALMGAVIIFGFIKIMREH